jgi:hypothetical protein
MHINKYYRKRDFIFILPVKFLSSLCLSVGPLIGNMCWDNAVHRGDIFTVLFTMRIQLTPLGVITHRLSKLDSITNPPLMQCVYPLYPINEIELEKGTISRFTLYAIFKCIKEIGFRHSFNNCILQQFY